MREYNFINWKFEWELKKKLKELYDKYNGDIANIAKELDMPYRVVFNAVYRFVPNYKPGNSKPGRRRKEVVV